MRDSLITIAYIAASALFIMSLGGLSRQETARRGNFYGILGMLIALVATGAAIKDGNYVKTATSIRKTNLQQIPSPYLTGVFDDFFIRYPHYNFMPVWETHRGCPYHCTFCDLGADYYNKVYVFETDRLLKEIDWFSKHKIEYIAIADANFGIISPIAGL